MFFSSLLAAAITFTATATGVEKGTNLEFIFVSSDSDRAYESMFLITDSLSNLCEQIETFGVRKGHPIIPEKCLLWPIGTQISVKPCLSEFISVNLPHEYPPFTMIYTGGERDSEGRLLALQEMPAAFCSTYSLSQSPIIPNGIFEQGAVYGSFVAARTLQKGKQFKFTIECLPDTYPKHLDVTFNRSNCSEILHKLKEASKDSELEVTAGFDEGLTIKEATYIANALSTIDSPRIKINGCSNIFYRAFTPAIKWSNRKERLNQPFELTLNNDGSYKLLFIEEDWSVVGDDPKLTEKQIKIEELSNYEKTDTCFIYTYGDCEVGKVVSIKNKMIRSNIKNWYIFVR